MRKLSWIIAGILCTTPALIHAAELGNAKVQSHLTEQLKVMIPLTGLNGIPTDEVKVQLAPESYYRQAGLSLDQLAGNITFQIKTEGSQSFILISSKRIITDPILSILVEVTSGESKVIKEFDLLLNPPAQKVVNKPAETNFNNTLRSVTPASPEAAAWQPIKNVPDVTMGGSYQVKRGDTLYDIAKRAAQDGSVSVRPMMQAIINANPAAFVGGNGNELKTGVTLKVPTSSVAKSTSVAKTEVTKNAPSTANPPPATKPKLQLLSSDTETAPAAANPTTNNTLVDGKLSAIDGTPTAATSSAPSAPTANSVQQNNEAIASIDAKSEAMSQQINLLNEQLKQVQGLITDRNQNIASLQQKIKAADEQTQLLKKQLEAQNNNFWIQWAPYLLGGAGLLVLILLLIVASRGRNREQFAPVSNTQLNSVENKFSSDASAAVNASKTTAITPKAATESQPLAAVAASVLPDFQVTVPPFDAKSIIDEARLLRSYNLNEQALDLLRESIAQHSDELTLYQELASIYAEDGHDAELNQIIAQIDSRFGVAHRPQVQKASVVSAADSTPNAFDEPFASPKMATNDELLGFVPEPLDALDASVFTHDVGLNFTPNEIAHEEAPMLEVNGQSAPAANVSPGLDDLTFDLSEFEPTKQPSFVDMNQSNDLDLELVERPDAALSASEPVLNTPPVESLFAAQNTVQNDTRLGLAEAFLGVGDEESYRMIADEIESEGDADLIAALRGIASKYTI